MSDNERPPASASLYDNLTENEKETYRDTDSNIQLSEEEKETCRKLNEYIVRNTLRKKKIPLECCCGFLTVVIIVLITMIVIRGNVIRSRLATKEQLLYFSRPGCPHCERFDPIWDNAVKKIKKDTTINISTKKINCKDPVNAAICTKESKDHGMKGVPHVVRINANGSRSIFTNERTVENLLTFSRN
jgi:hypothetical protein